jgi:hypothetical protein
LAYFCVIEDFWPQAASPGQVLFVLQYPHWLSEVAVSLKGFDTFFVGIKAPLSVI